MTAVLDDAAQLCAPDTLRSSGRRPAYLALLCALLGGLNIFVLQRVPIDDGFIVSRYVRRIVAGHGWSYNDGEAWNAITSPLHGMLSALTAAVGVGADRAPIIAGTVALAVGAWLLGATLNRHGLGLAAWTIPPFVLLVPMIRNGMGLETQLYVGMLLAVIALEIRCSTSWALLGAVVLVRPEGGLLLVWILGCAILRTRRLPVRGILTAAAVCAPWAAYSLWRFGTLLPDSAANKADQAASGLWATYGSGTISNLEATFGAGWFLLPAMATAGGLAAVRRWGWAAIGPLVLVIGQHLLYTFLGAPDYGWYYVPSLVIAAVYALIGLDELRSQVSPIEGRWIGALVIAAVGITVLPSRPDVQAERAKMYAAAAQVTQAEGATSVAMAEVGAAGYALPDDVVIYDLIGLTSPNPGAFQPGGGVDAFFAAGPDALIVHHHDWKAPGHVRPWPAHEGVLLDDPRFAGQYVEAKRLPYLSGEGLVVFVRRDLRHR